MLENLLKADEIQINAEVSIGSENTSVFKLLLVLLQHNSYHIGQLVMVRKFLGDWPPSED